MTILISEEEQIHIIENIQNTMRIALATGFIVGVAVGASVCWLLQ